MSFDINKLQQACNNLIPDAIKFIPDSGSISVTAGHEGKQVLVMVADTGGRHPSAVAAGFVRCIY